MRNAFFLQLLKVYARFLEQLDRIIHDVLLPQVELEVELPGGDAGGQTAVQVGEVAAQTSNAVVDALY